MQEINKLSEFNSATATQEPVFIKFGAPWCGPCRIVDQALVQVDAELGDKVKIIKVNVDEAPEIASAFGVMSIPAMFLQYHAEDVQQQDKLQGALPAQGIIDFIKNRIGE